MSSKSLLKFNSHYVVLALACAFVLYHFGQYLVSPSEWVKSVIFPVATTHQVQPTVAPIKIAPPASSSASIQSVVKLGLATTSNQWPTQIIIPTVKVDLSLTGSIENNGVWDISQTGANFALNTAIPNGHDGNTVLFGHDRQGLFHPIHNLAAGQIIDLITPTGTYIYQMEASQIVSPTDISVMDQTATAKLTLITCNGWTSDKRFVVTATFKQFIPSVQLENSAEVALASN